MDVSLEGEEVLHNLLERVVVLDALDPVLLKVLGLFVDLLNVLLQSPGALSFDISIVFLNVGCDRSLIDVKGGWKIMELPIVLSCQQYARALNRLLHVLRFIILSLANDFRPSGFIVGHSLFLVDSFFVFVVFMISEAMLFDL